MYDFQTKSDAFLDINPLTKIVAFLVANILILGVKTYKVEIVFCILILFLGICIFYLLEKRSFKVLNKIFLLE